MQKVRRALRVRGCGEDRALVVLQNFKPCREIGCVVFARFGRDFKIGAEKRRAKLGDKFLGSVTGIAPTLAPEFTVEARLMACPVRLMPISA